MPITSDSRSKAIWAQIIATLVGEMNVGTDGVPGHGTNSTGRLPTLRFTHNTIHLWSNLFPAIGVQLVDESRKPMAQRTQTAMLTFKIVAATKANPAADTSIHLDDAYAQLTTLLEDGAGHGLLAVLGDFKNTNVQGLSMFARISNVKYDWDVDKAVGTTDARAYAYIDYLVETQTSY